MKGIPSEQIDGVVQKLNELYSQVSLADHKMIVNATRNRLSPKQLFEWYKKSAHNLTEEMLAIIRIDTSTFFNCELNPNKNGYVPLAERKYVRSTQSVHSLI